MNDAATLLWTDAAFGASAAKAQTRFADVVRVVASRAALRAPERGFLERADRVGAEADGESVWVAPRAYWWAARAMSLLDDRDALALHLPSFTTNVVEIGIDSTTPVACHDGYVVPVAPAPFDIPDWPLAEPALAAGLEYHRQHVDLVERTLATIATFAPDTFAAFRRIIRAIGLKPRWEGGYDDFSNPELPGTFIASVRPEPLVLADHFVHELQHNRLSFVEELGAVFDDDRPAVRCYSPWREDARSLYGVFHGVYVFLGVHRYWSRVDAAGLEGAAGAYARDRVVRIPRQLAIAVELLQNHAPLTPFGAALLAELTRAVTAACALALTSDVAAYAACDDGSFVPEISRVDGHSLSVIESVAEHRRIYE